MLLLSESWFPGPFIGHPDHRREFAVRHFAEDPQRFYHDCKWFWKCLSPKLTTPSLFHHTRSLLILNSHMVTANLFMYASYLENIFIRKNLLAQMFRDTRYQKLWISLQPMVHEYIENSFLPSCFQFPLTLYRIKFHQYPQKVPMAKPQALNHKTFPV